jgi:hypothetical protein
MRIEYTISGYLVGQIWMPATECWKDVNYTFVRHEEDRANPWQDAREDLREAMLHVTNDGDFQSCGVSHGVLTARILKQGAGRRYVHEHSWPLDQFPSVCDMVRTDWEGPVYDED